MPACAYCGSTSQQITREHIWPRCMLDRTKHELRFSGKAQKIVRADLTIKDVCQSCNNGPLSELDHYFCSLYDQYFVHEIKAEEPIFFRYDYGLLARALLKIAFNSARTADVDVDILSSYAPVVMSAGTVPVGLHIKLSTICTYERLEPSGEIKSILARAARCGPVTLANRDPVGLTARIVQIEGYRFYLIITPSINDRGAAVRYLANESGAWLSSSGESFVHRPAMSAFQAFQGIQNWRT